MAMGRDTPPTMKSEGASQASQEGLGPSTGQQIDLSLLTLTYSTDVWKSEKKTAAQLPHSHRNIYDDRLVSIIMNTSMLDCRSSQEIFLRDKTVPNYPDPENISEHCGQIVISLTMASQLSSCREPQCVHGSWVPNRAKLGPHTSQLLGSRLTL